MKISIEKDVENQQGISKISSSEWGGCIYSFDRTAVQAHKLPTFIECVGVYIIYGDYFDKQSNKTTAYVGESNNVKNRLESHYKNKDFWNKVLVFCHPKLDAAKTLQVEEKFIQLVKLASRYEQDNRTKGTNASNPDEQFIATFVNNSKNMLELANIDIFKLNEDCVFTYRLSNQIDCKLKKANGNYELLQGSTVIRTNTGPNIDDEKRAPLLADLLSQGKIAPVSDNQYVVSTSILLDEEKLFLLTCSHSLRSWKSITGISLN